jgi:hypothetical protein
MEPRTHEIDELLVSLCRKARLGDFGDAAADLNRFLLLVQKSQPVMQSVPKPLLEKFNYSMETIFLMLKNKDWVAIADIVEYELIALWRDLAGSIDAK